MSETKTVLLTLFNFLGIPVTFLGIIENYGTWKSDVLLFLSVLYLVIKIIFFAVDKFQISKHKNMQLERERFELDKVKNKK